MEPKGRREQHWQQAEADTVSGLRSVWGTLAIAGGVGAMVVLLFLYLPPVWVAVAMVVLALLIGGAVLARGMQRPRHRL